MNPETYHHEYFHGFPSWPHGVSRKAILRAQLTPMILGGDHAITAPVCAALAVLQKPLAAGWNWGHLGPGGLCPGLGGALGGALGGFGFPKNGDLW